MDGSSSSAISGPKAPNRGITGKMQQLSREARSNQRRLLTAFGIDTDSDLLKFNQLKVHIKNIKLHFYIDNSSISIFIANFI